MRDWVTQNVGPDGSFRDFEHQLVARDGAVRWVRVSAVGLLDADGSRIGQRGTGRDITERKLAEQHLAESRKFLDELINAVPDPISVKDEQHRFVAVNHAFCRIVGCTREAILGKDDAGLIPAEEARQVWQTDETALKGTEPVVYERGVTLQGAKRWMLVRKSGITRSDASRAVLSVFTDITERRAMEQAVRDSETRFRDFTAAASEFVWENDLEGRFTYVSSRVQSVWGYSEPELLGRSPAQLTPPGEAERVREWLAAHQQPDGSFRDLEQRIAGQERRGALAARQRASACSTRTGRRIGQRGAGARHHRAQAGRSAHRRARHARPPERAAQPRAAQRSPAVRAGHCTPAQATGWASCSSTWTASSTSTTASVTRWATTCCGRVARRFGSCLRESDTLARLGGDEFVVVLDALHSAEDAKHRRRQDPALPVRTRSASVRTRWSPAPASA